jgi:chemotaxis protein MotB
MSGLETGEITTQDQASPEYSTRVWMLTFTDLVALMLSFFVMLFAMSSVTLTEWRSVIDSLSQTLRREVVPVKTAPSSAFNIGTIFRKQAIDIDYLASVLAEAVGNLGSLSRDRVLRLEDRLIIVLAGDDLFQPGQVRLTAGGPEALFALGGVLRNIGNQIDVNAYAAPTAPAGSAYASGWELATARGSAVANALHESGYAGDIVAFGRAATATADGSGRIEIVVRPTAGGS